MNLRAALVGACAMALGAGAILPAQASASAPSLTGLERQFPAMTHHVATGSSGHYVRVLQADLISDGYPSVKQVDGIFGSRTLRALKAFQSANHLRPSGVATAATWQDLIAQLGLAPYYSSSEQSAPPRTSPAATTANSVAASSSSQRTIDGRPVKAVYHMLATAYGPSAQDNYPYGAVDAFGQPLRFGMIAVDPSVIPLHSYVYVSGYHSSVLPSGGFLGHAMDTGGAIQGHRIDIFMNQGPATVSHFGIESVTVTLLGN